MSTTLPPTQSLSPTMRQTLELIRWAAEGLANANRIRRARISGVEEFSGADAMHMYLKSQGVDIQRLDDLMRGLMQDGKTASAIKEVVDVVSDAAVKSPKDLSELVQRLASAATGSTPPPNTTPAAAPPGTTWTASTAGKTRFRSEYTSAARAQARPAECATPSGGKPRFRPEYTSAARASGVTPHAPPVSEPPPAANDLPCTDPSVCVDMSKESAVPGAASCACTDLPPPGQAPATPPARSVEPPPSPEASEARRSQRLDALEQRLDALEAELKRELTELREWTTEQLRALSERVAATEAASERLKQEHAALKQRVQELEAALASREDEGRKKLPEETCSSGAAEPAASAPGGELVGLLSTAAPPETQGAGSLAKTGTQDGAKDTPADRPPAQVAEVADVPAAGQAEAQAPIAPTPAVPLAGAADPASPSPGSADSRMDVTEGRRGELGSMQGFEHDVAQQVQDIHDKLSEQAGEKSP